MFAEATARAKQRLDGVSFLREIGVRNATLVIDRAGRKTRWTVPEISVDLEHRKRRSVISGSATIASPKGPWSITFVTEDSEGATGRSLTVKSSVRGLQPSTLAALLPELTNLDNVEVPLAGDVTLDLSNDGGISAGRLALELGRGQIRLPSVNDTSAVVDGGLVTINYDGAARRFTLAPSTIVSGKSRVTVVGEMTSETGSEGAAVWPFKIRAREGTLAARGFPLAVHAAGERQHEGVVIPSTGIIKLNSAAVRAGGAGGALTGEVTASLGAISARFEGALTPITADTLKTLWPKVLAPGGPCVGRPEAQSRNDPQRVIQVFERKLSHGAGAGRSNGLSSVSDDRGGRSAVHAGDQCAAGRGASGPHPHRERDAGGRASGSDGYRVAEGSKIPLKGVRFAIADTRPDIPIGEVTFRAVAPLPAMIELADLAPYEILKRAGVKPEGVDGKFEGQFKIVWPLTPSVDPADVKIEGKGRVFEGRAKQLAGPYDIQGAAVAFDVSEKAADAKGEMLISGVPAKLSWQRIFDAPPTSSRRCA